MQPNTQRPALPRLLAAALGLLSLNALYGGGALTLDPSGGRLRLPRDLLAGSPFPDYRVPGLVLLLGFGVAPPAVVAGLLLGVRRPALLGHGWPWLGAVAIGVAQVIWLGVQVAVIGYQGALQVTLLVLALLIVALAPGVRRRFEA
jgi:hypothetical protein